jgi:hypothetical protein
MIEADGEAASAAAGQSRTEAVRATAAQRARRFMLGILSTAGPPGAVQAAEQETS